MSLRSRLTDNDDGTIHESTYSTDHNVRYSRDMDSDGNLTGRHIVDQDDGEIHNLPDCKVEDDDMF